MALCSSVLKRMIFCVSYMWIHYLMSLIIVTVMSLIIVMVILDSDSDVSDNSDGEILDSDSDVPTNSSCKKIVTFCCSFYW